MIDLHTHTDESDGTYSPSELIGAAQAAGITTLAITDHDTFEGYEKAVRLDLNGLRLIRGIELNTRQASKSVHLLAYFPEAEPGPVFVAWLRRMIDARRDRNLRLIQRLRDLGVDIEIEEVEALGRSLTGRPHFARVLVSKGYVASREEAFERYIGESGSAFIERESPGLFETIDLVRRSGGLTSLPHPIRINGGRDESAEARLVGQASDAGLDSLEVFHSDHSDADRRRYQALAEKHRLGITGGSDFHGANKSNAKLGHWSSGLRPIPPEIVRIPAAIERRIP